MRNPQHEADSDACVASRPKSAQIPGRFRKRPVEVDAICWDGSNWNEVCDFLGVPLNGHGDAEALRSDPLRMPVIIHTLEGDMRAELGDWIVCGIQGEFYPVKAAIFLASYERVGS